MTSLLLENVSAARYQSKVSELNRPIAIAIDLLTTAKCAYPSAHDGSNIQVVDYVAPALEDSQVSFSCSPGMDWC